MTGNRAAPTKPGADRMTGNGRRWERADRMTGTRGLAG